MNLIVPVLSVCGVCIGNLVVAVAPQGEHAARDGVVAPATVDDEVALDEVVARAAHYFMQRTRVGVRSRAEEGVLREQVLGGAGIGSHIRRHRRCLALRRARNGRRVVDVSDVSVQKWIQLIGMRGAGCGCLYLPVELHPFGMRVAYIGVVRIGGYLCRVALYNVAFQTLVGMDYRVPLNIVPIAVDRYVRGLRRAGRVRLDRRRRAGRLVVRRGDGRIVVEHERGPVELLHAGGPVLRDEGGARAAAHVVLQLFTRSGASRRGRDQVLRSEAVSLVVAHAHLLFA